MVFRANRTEDTFTRAAIILHAIGSQHPFMDGNKRTALIVAENVLDQSGFFIAADEDSIVQFMLEVASYTHDPDEIEQWLREHSEAL
jgi:death-on-curing protein